MRIRLLVSLSGTRNGQEWPPAGNSMDLPDDEAIQLCESKMAIPMVEPKNVEVAIAPLDDVELRLEPAVPATPKAQERPLTTKTGPGPGRRGSR